MTKLIADQEDVQRKLTLTEDLGGRPKVIFTPEQILQVEELAKKLTTRQIADYMGIGEATFNAVRKRQPEVSIAYKRGRQWAIHWVVSKLMDKIQQGDTACTIFYLKTQAGWSEKQKDITATIQSILHPLIVKINDQKSAKDAS